MVTLPTWGSQGTLSPLIEAGRKRTRQYERGLGVFTRRSGFTCRSEGAAVGNCTSFMRGRGSWLDGRWPWLHQGTVLLYLYCISLLAGYCPKVKVCWSQPECFIGRLCDPRLQIILFSRLVTHCQYIEERERVLDLYYNSGHCCGSYLSS
jgi:hypothetical protein